MNTIEVLVLMDTDEKVFVSILNGHLRESIRLDGHLREKY